MTERLAAGAGPVASHARRDPAFSTQDLYEMVAISVLTPASWLVPRRLWVPFGHALSLGIALLRPDVTARRMRRLREALGPAPSNRTLFLLRVGIMSAYMEERMQILREYRPGGGWRPAMRLIGREHLEAARAAGRGAILMVSPFSYADLVSKKALHEAGYATSHLSLFSRGFSPNSCHLWQPTRFGMQVLSRLRTRVEDRYLGERVIVPRDGHLGYLRRLDQRLRDNGMVSMRAGDLGQRTVEVELFNGRLRFASGAPNLALANGAALIPVFVVRTGLSAFDVIVEPPLAPRAGLERAAALEDILERYAARLEHYIRTHPRLWSGWYRLKMNSARNAGA